MEFGIELYQFRRIFLLTLSLFNMNLDGKNGRLTERNYMLISHLAKASITTKILPYNLLNGLIAVQRILQIW